MTEDEARREAARRNRGHGDWLWGPRRCASGDWEVVRAAVPPRGGQEELRASVAPPLLKPDPAADAQFEPYPYWWA